jgi:hypothetical protein
MLPQLEQDLPAVPRPPEVEWSLATRIGFRFAFSYFFLYIAPGAVGSLGVAEHPGSYRAVFSELWQQIVPWVGTSVLGLKGSLREIPNGSGDQLYDYVLILCIFVTALFVTAVWSVLDRKRKSYQQAYQWLRLFVRLNLAATMMIYGASKLLPMQFAEIPLGRLLDPLGHLSPMGLLWSFMGYSRAYSFFGGAGEMLGGVLLIVPAFSTLGALVSLGVLSNVLMLNLCYDVPRKIFTIHLILMAVFLVLPDTRRILNLFIFNRTAEPSPTVPLLKDKQLNRGVLILQYLYGAASLALAFYVCYAPAVRNQERVAAPLRGIWSVEQFVSNDVPMPLLVTEKERWHHVIFDAPDVLTIQPMKGNLQLYALKLGQDGKNLTISSFGDPPMEGAFTLVAPDPDRMSMTGHINGQSISATLKRTDLSNPSEFLLPNRGFHWVTPVPRWR